MASQDRVITFINDVNSPPKNISDVNVTFENPEIDTVEGDDWNTKVLISAAPGRGYFGTQTVFYIRADLSEIADLEVRSETGFTHDEIIEMINNQIGTSIGFDELEPITIPELSLGDSAQIDLTAEATSLGFVGTTTITLTYGRPFFNAVIGVRVLPVLVHGFGMNGLPLAKVLSYDFDFSSYRDSLKRDPNTLLPVNIPALQDVTKKLGFPDWNSGKLRDYATAEIVDSNPAFDRVAVVDISSNGMVSPLYFHYNNFDGA